MPISAPKIPDGLPELMRGLAKSVIKENPENLYVHAAEYFENLIRERDGELERGYKTFNAYQVYADYKERGREKLGLSKGDGSSVSDGDDGDGSGSGGSGPKTRGRRRARRTRRQTSREPDNPPTMVERSATANDGELQKLNSMSEESAPVVPVVEQEVVKVHYTPPEGPPVARVVSAQSVEAEQAVSIVLDDEQILDSDGTAGKETGDELLDNGDDVGTAPSTAEITESPPGVVEESSAMSLQDMETCFVHANVDDLLEKSPENVTLVGSGTETATEVAHTLSSKEGEDIPEGPQHNAILIENAVDSEPLMQDVSGLEEKKEVQKDDSTVENVPAEGTTLEDRADVTAPNAADVVSEEDEKKAVKTLEENIELKSTDNEDNIGSELLNDDARKEPEDSQGRSQSTEKNDQPITADGVEAVDDDLITKAEGKMDLPSNEVAVEESRQEEVNAAPPTTDEPVEAEPEPIVEPTNVTSRMGLDEDDTADGPSQTVDSPSGNPAAISDAVQTPDENKILQIVDENSSVPQEENNSFTEEAPSNEESKESIVENSNETDVILQTEQSVENDSIVLPPDAAQDPTYGDTEPVKEILTKTKDQPAERDAAEEEPVVQEDSAIENNVEEPPVPDTHSSEVVLDVKAAEMPPEIDNAPENVNTEVNEKADDVNKAIEDPASTGLSEEKQDITVKGESPVLPSTEADGNDGGDQTASNYLANANVEDLKAKSEEKDDNSMEQSVEQLETTSDPAGAETMQPESYLPNDDQASKEPTLSDKPEPTDGTMEDDPEGEAAKNDVSPSVDDRTKEDVAAAVEQPANVAEVKAEGNEDESVDDKPNDGPSVVNDDVARQPSTEALTLESAVMEILPQLLAGGTGEADNVGAEHVDVSSITSTNGSTDKESEPEEPAADTNVVNKEEIDKTPPIEAAPDEQQKDVDVDDKSSEPAKEPTPTELQSEYVAPVGENLDDAGTEQTAKDGGTEREESQEEVIEEPCVKREVTPTRSMRLEREDSAEKQVEELEEIKKVDLSQLSKDSAEALFYSLKRSELENQEPESTEDVGAGSRESNGDDDDKDVVVTEEPLPAPPVEREGSTKRTFTDDFLDEDPITGGQPTDTASGGGVQEQAEQQQEQQEIMKTTEAVSSLEAGEQGDEFNPMMMVSMRSKQFQEHLHSREIVEDQSDAPAEPEATPKRPPLMRRCMTEMTGLQRYDTTVDEETVDPPLYDPDYVEEEDQFDGYYIGHIKNKILASSVSVADSDYFDPTRSTEEPVDENNVRTALETIASTDTESTIASQATIQQAGKREYLRKHSQNTSSNLPYASFGNAAIDRSLDEFIEREERDKQDEAMAEAATKIQRSYRTHKKRLLRDYHSTMRTCTEDQSAESGEEYASNVIQIKLDQKRTGGAPSSLGEESDSSLPHQPLGVGKRPMYSLNIDEYDTVARRMTLTRGVALQRNSTPDDDSGKSTNASTDRKPSLSSPLAAESAPTSGSGEGQEGRSSSAEEKPDERAAEPTAGPACSSGEREQDDGHSSSRSRLHRTTAGVGRDALPKGAGRTTTIGAMDVQSLLLIARQRTMPVQIDSSVIRVLPKHMRKRISSAGMLHDGGKRK